MRRSRAEKSASHERIITEAARMLREGGPDRTNIADVMKAAGLTHGGFYGHFKSREALLAAALPVAFEDFGARIMQHLAQAEGGTPNQNFASFYLSQLHIDDLGGGCPLAALGSDVARASSELKAHFGEGLRRVIGALTMTIPGGNASRTDLAIRQIAMLVGAVILARASDQETGRTVVAACVGTARPPAER